MLDNRAVVLAALAALSVAACASVAGFDIDQERGTVDDDDDSLSMLDGATTDPTGQEGGAGDGSDAGVDAAPPAFVACGCPAAEGCCVPGTGAATCVAPGDAGQCSGGGGLFLRCVAGDVFNGRTCCLAKDGRSSFFEGGECEDAGAKLCADDTECTMVVGAACRRTNCRDVAIGVCAKAADPLPVCPR